jgi:hypothetical protein
MTQLELVKFDSYKISSSRTGQHILKTVVAVSTSYEALSHYAKTNGISFNNGTIGRQTYYLIQESDIVIVPFNVKRQ